jgi:uncharacterized protein
VGPIALLVDAGPLYALVDANDAEHDTCSRLLATYPGPLIVPLLVVAETAHLIATRLGPHVEVRFLGDLARGLFATEPVLASDWNRIAALVWEYQDVHLGTVDASVIAAAERLDIRTVATLDRRHFSVVRPRHVPSFELLP